ncbi:MAG: pyruvate synthase subunit beta [Candidatus Latescibacterota bacterium]|nr:MAG: pyruvate synthase subunit beta [Candidatus Latescibacterota bacterium]
MSNCIIPDRELMSSGHLGCQGCGAGHAMRFALKGLGPKSILVMPACCWSVIDGPFPHSSLGVPLFHTAFETAGSTASGIKAGLVMRGDTETEVVAWAGDGGTFDIGLQALSGAAERNEDIIYVCYDNEAYMNTGIQRSGATPAGAWTTTTPTAHPKEHPKKKMLDILVAHSIPYATTTSIAYPEDMVAKFKKVRKIRGTRFVHIFAPCPTGWKTAPEYTIELARLATESHLFPLLEVYDGERWEIAKPQRVRSVADYVKLQGRFRHLKDEDIEKMQKEVDENWERLLAKESLNSIKKH